MASDIPKRRKSDLLLPKADLSDPAIHTAKELRRGIRILMVATVVVYIFLLVVAGYVYRQAQRNTRALCTIRNNAQTRVDDTTDFLRDHPNGIGGISVTDLRRSIETSKATVRALDDVDCPPPNP